MSGFKLIDEAISDATYDRLWSDQEEAAKEHAAAKSAIDTALDP